MNADDVGFVSQINGSEGRSPQTYADRIVPASEFNANQIGTVLQINANQIGSPIADHYQSDRSPVAMKCRPYWSGILVRVAT